MSRHLGDFNTGSVVYDKFSTIQPSTGAPFTLAGSPVLSVYKDNSTSESVAGVTLTPDFDGRTGLNHIAINTAADGTFYSAGSFFTMVLTAGTVDGVSTTGFVVGAFTLDKTSALKPATADRKLVIDANGAVILTPNQSIGNVTSGVTLSPNQSVNIVGNITGNLLGNVSGSVNTVTNNVPINPNLSVNITGNMVGNVTGNLSGSVGTLLGNVTLAAITHTGATIPQVNTVVNTTNLLNLPNMPVNWVKAAGVENAALNGKGDWLVAANYTIPPTVGAIAAQITTDHGSGSYTRNTEPDNANIAIVLTNTGSILAKTNNLPIDPAGITNIPTVDQIWAKTMTELGAIPSVSGSVLHALNLIFTLSRNKVIQTGTNQTIYKDDGVTVLGVANTTNDDLLGTFTKGKLG